MSREPLNRFAPNLQGRRVWSPAQSRLKFKVKGQGHQGQKRHFSALSAACMRFVFAKTSLASSFSVHLRAVQSLTATLCGCLSQHSMWQQLLFFSRDFINLVRCVISRHFMQGSRIRVYAKIEYVSVRTYLSTNRIRVWYVSYDTLNSPRLIRNVGPIFYNLLFTSIRITGSIEKRINLK